MLGHARRSHEITLEGPARILTAGIGGLTFRPWPRTNAWQLYGQRLDAPPTDAQLAVAGRVLIELRIEGVDEQHRYRAAHLKPAARTG